MRPDTARAMWRGVAMLGGAWAITVAIVFACYFAMRYALSLWHPGH